MLNEPVEEEPSRHLVVDHDYALTHAIEPVQQVLSQDLILIDFNHARPHGTGALRCGSLFVYLSKKQDASPGNYMYWTRAKQLLLARASCADSARQ